MKATELNKIEIKAAKDIKSWKDRFKEFMRKHTGEYEMEVRAVLTGKDLKVKDRIVVNNGLKFYVTEVLGDGVYNFKPLKRINANQLNGIRSYLRLGRYIPE